jgi:CRISPR-associated protein Csb3
MAEASIPVDLINPGQVFACLGLMEAAEILCGPCEGRFDYRGSESAAHFALSRPRVGSLAFPSSRGSKSNRALGF